MSMRLSIVVPYLQDDLAAVLVRKVDKLTWLTIWIERK